MQRNFTSAERQKLITHFKGALDKNQLDIVDMVNEAAQNFGMLEMKAATLFDLEEFPGLLIYRVRGGRTTHLRKGPGAKGLCGARTKGMKLTEPEGKPLCGSCAEIARGGGRQNERRTSIKKKH